MTKQIVVAFAGPDMCGKTQMVKALSDTLNVPAYKAASEHADFIRTPERFIQNLRFADTRMFDMLKQCKYSMILDRCWACEFVYSKALNRQTDEETLKKVDEMAAGVGTKVIIARRSSYEGISDDLDPKRLNGSMLKKIDDLYVEFSKWTKCETLFLNVDDENLSREINEVLFWLNSKGCILWLGNRRFGTQKKKLIGTTQSFTIST
jgi:thymidylate kinase